MLSSVIYEAELFASKVSSITFEAELFASKVSSTVFEAEIFASKIILGQTMSINRISSSTHSNHE